MFARSNGYPCRAPFRSTASTANVSDTLTFRTPIISIVRHVAGSKLLQIALVSELSGSSMHDKASVAMGIMRVCCYGHGVGLLLWVLCWFVAMGIVWVCCIGRPTPAKHLLKGKIVLDQIGLTIA
jgi:hypothetical protein